MGDSVNSLNCCTGGKKTVYKKVKYIVLNFRYYKLAIIKIKYVNEIILVKIILLIFPRHAHYQHAYLKGFCFRFYQRKWQNYGFLKVKEFILKAC